MEPRQLGQTEIKISPIILGTWAIGGSLWGGTDEEAAIAAIKTSLDQGVNTVDTAPIYGMGKSEELVGKAILGIRHKVILATKCGLRWDSDVGVEPWIQETPDGKKVLIRKSTKPESILHECEESLKRLQTDVIDLYQIHWPDPSTPISEAWSAMVKLKQQGKVRAIGVSNFNLEQLKEAHEIHPVDSIQPPYSLIRRGIEKEIVPFCMENKISILAYSPLERGLLSGTVSTEREFPKGDHRAMHPLFSIENRKAILEALQPLQALADKYKATLSQIVIHCTIHQPGITAALVGARSAIQAAENASSTRLPLTEDENKFIANLLNKFQIPS